ncbi:cysteine protease StiP family protein [Thalassospira xiamenensis]|uniref:PELOTA RNA binding domain-containing protein n=1 Tax=Thalassospira xiamenensis TaxID=220697 RepID=A0A285TS20_9PROT|nr:cysteine protease StiP family protein [Thalassospira xiamenensis]SOC26515.1 PELOTA RNA binding domain-containing protein [Thalassospira xiamenensis]
MNIHRSGSYEPDDVTFLLKFINMASTPVDEKEELIQSGRQHYSEMLSAEHAPDASYMEFFWSVLERNKHRFASDIWSLANCLSAARPGSEITLVSLARAGTPVGVLLKHTLSMLARNVNHYSISIIRDRGIDENALRYITENHNDSSIVFVDGWTGKGAITRELKTAVAKFNAKYNCRVPDDLAVIADLAGVADFTASSEDYLIPSSILNAVVSGLVSRTVLNKAFVGPNDYHGCVFYDHLREHDISRQFVNVITECIRQIAFDGYSPASPSTPSGANVNCEEFIDKVMSEYQISDRNRVKPGIGESTRSLLRRVPDTLIVQDENHPDTAHLIELANERGVTVRHDPNLQPPYRATVIIKTLGEG